MADLSNGPAGGLTGWLTMQQGMAPVINSNARLGQFLQDEPLNRDAKLAEIQAQQYANSQAPMLTQAKMQGTPFEQQKFAEQQQQEALQRQMQQLQFNRQQSLAEETLRHNRAGETRQTDLEHLKIKQAAWKNAMDAYAAGMGPHPSTLPEFASMGMGGMPQEQGQQGGMAGGRPITGVQQPPVIPMPEDLAKLPPGARMKILAARVEERPHANAGLNEALANIDRIQQASKEIYANTRLPTSTGIPGVVMRNIPGTAEKGIDKSLESLKAQVAFATLNQLRQQSKTGGALGQVSNQEENMLASSLASIDPQQSTEDLQKSLGKIVNLTSGAQARLIEAYKRTYGVEPDLSSYMESKKLAAQGLQQPKGGAPQAGQVVKGYRFKGGDPASPDSWEKQ